MLRQTIRSGEPGLTDGLLSTRGITTFYCQLAYFKRLSTVFGTAFIGKTELGVQRTLRANDRFLILYTSDQSILQINGMLGPLVAESRLDLPAQ